MDDWNDFGYDDSRTPRASDARISFPPRRASTLGRSHPPQHPSHASLPLPDAAPRRLTTAPASYASFRSPPESAPSLSASAPSDVNSNIPNSRLYELADSYSSFSSSAGGGPGSVTGAEPRSIMMPALHKRAPSSIIPPPPDAHNKSARDKNMDLDDAEFDEWGSAASARFNTASYSSDRFHKPSYTKLEVFTAQQIQQLLNCFHLVLTFAVAWTLFSIIMGNVSWARTQLAPINRKLLGEKQINDNRKQTLSLTARSLYLTNHVRTSEMHYEIRPSRECTLCYFQRHDICYQWNTFVQCPTPNNYPICKLCDQPTLRLSPSTRFKSKDHLQVGIATRQSHSPAFRTNRYNVGNAQDHLSLNKRLTFRQQKNQFDIEFFAVRSEVTPIMYRTVNSVVIGLCGTVLLVLGTLFMIRLVRAGRQNVSQEQMFACAMMFGSFLYFSVPLAIRKIYPLFADIDLSEGELHGFPDLLNKLHVPMQAMRFIFFPPFLFFFFWANIHSYRILDPKKKLTASFYAPKILLLAPLLGIKLALYHFEDIRPSFFPFISIIVLQHSFGRFNFRRAWPEKFYLILALTLYEAILVAYSIWQAVLTTRALRKVTYMKHRSKHTGFRFFMYINLVFYLSFFLLQTLTIIGKPYGNLLWAVELGPGAPLDLRLHDSHESGTLVLLFSYIVIWAYVNLPYDSIGAVKGWFVGTEMAPSSMRWSSFSGKDSHSSTSNGMDSDTASGTESASYSQGYSSRAKRPASDSTPIFKVDRDYELDQEIAEPITYRQTESDKSVELKANCFTMQTHVILFNFAWYVYYYGTPKFEAINQDGEEQILPFQFEIAESIREESTDTQALVIDSDDRIIVTFKGSTSLRNLKTSLAAFHEKLRNVVPTNTDNGIEQQRIQEIFGRVYESAKIHKGFAMAYQSVAHRVMNAIKVLHDEKPRPIFLTGHSLGGALATICSLDVWVKLRISRRQIFVSTFGSPRVGNDAFKKIYNSVIALHWRIVVDPDMVAKLPKGMYRHVGKKVMLTQHGNLFIDPSALELKLWSGSTAGFAYHRKASYLLAMEAWCLRHHKLSYVPKFWEFPVKDEDRQRFQGAIADPEASMHINTEDSLAPRSRLIKKIILLDAMVDSLDDGTEPNNAEAVEKWARLTRRLLLRAKLSATVTGKSNSSNNNHMSILGNNNNAALITSGAESNNNLKQIR